MAYSAGSWGAATSNLGNTVTVNSTFHPSPLMEKQELPSQDRMPDMNLNMEVLYCYESILHNRESQIKKMHRTLFDSLVLPHIAYSQSHPFLQDTLQGSPLINGSPLIVKEVFSTYSSFGDFCL